MTKAETVERRRGMEEFNALLKGLRQDVQAIDHRLVAYETRQDAMAITVDTNTKWINGNGKTGAKTQLASHESRIRMLFIVGGAIATFLLTLIGTVTAALVVAWITISLRISSSIVIPNIIPEIIKIMGHLLQSG